jgi:hypothetical protein
MGGNPVTKSPLYRVTILQNMPFITKIDNIGVGDDEREGIKVKKISFNNCTLQNYVLKELQLMPSTLRNFPTKHGK